LTPRDRDLLAHVAVARYLTAAQIKRLVFAAPAAMRLRSNVEGINPPADQVQRRRLGLLTGSNGGIAYLRRLSYRDGEGARIFVYAITPHGFAVARDLLERPVPLAAQDVKPQFLAHTVTLNNLYVALAEASRKARRGPAHFPFVWLATESAGLPWRERNPHTAHIEERRLVPDAILELREQKTRVFLECEMGGHPLVRRDEHALGSVSSKLQRYGSFMIRGEQHSFYAQKYGDGWEAELVFLVHSDDRAANVSKLITEWRAQNRAVPLAVRAFSFEQAPAHFCGRLRLPVAPDPGPPVSAHEAQLTCSFVDEVIATYKSVRHYLRANPGVREAGCPYPEYSASFEPMVAFTARLREQLQKPRSRKDGHAQDGLRRS
jgi:hypothetical protein